MPDPDAVWPTPGNSPLGRQPPTLPAKRGGGEHR